jgi:tRNA G10  N-methylase Trm11
MPVYLIRLAQAHESFRKVELQALAEIAGVNLEFVSYEQDVGHTFVDCHEPVPSRAIIDFPYHAFLTYLVPILSCKSIIRLSCEISRLP